jgi:hypothetical protein
MEFLIGIFVGGLLFWLFVGLKKPSGKIIIDFRDVAQTPLTLKLNEHIDDIYRKKSILLEVETHDYESQQ